MPRIVTDLCAARSIHIALIDGIETMAGGEGPSIRGVHCVKPGVVLAGFNPVTTDTVATAVMGYDLRSANNTLLLAQKLGLGSADLKQIEMSGLILEQAKFSFAG